MHCSQYHSTVAVLCMLATVCIAQQRISAPRVDGHVTPLLVYAAQGAVRGCAPLAVISHGAGGSENGYRYLAEAMTHLGYTTIVMGHRESGLEALRSDMRADGMLAGVRALVADPQAEQARLLDVGAALAWADKQCHAPFRVLLGHSMGSETVMLEAGARNIIAVPSPPAGQDRFDAYVALSPEGPGVVFPEKAWHGIHKPILILTGTRDQSLKGGPQARQIPWHDLPGSPRRCQWMGVIDGATHMNFAGNGIGHESVERQVTQTTTEFLSRVTQPGHSCVAPAGIAGMSLQAK
ncbi:MAG TPA: hypothetical protein VN151_08365 [Terracidiphilus sp.]|nr:hypothetical protein [Terracidiphilus sp.]